MGKCMNDRSIAMGSFVRGYHVYLHRSRSNSLKRRSSVQLRLPFCTWSSYCANAPSWTLKPMIATVK